MKATQISGFELCWLQAQICEDHSVKFKYSMKILIRKSEALHRQGLTDSSIDFKEYLFRVLSYQNIPMYTKNKITKQSNVT